MEREWRWDGGERSWEGMVMGWRELHRGVSQRIHYAIINEGHKIPTAKHEDGSKTKWQG